MGAAPGGRRCTSDAARRLILPPWPRPALAPQPEPMPPAAPLDLARAGAHAHPPIGTLAAVLTRVIRAPIDAQSRGQVRGVPPCVCLDCDRLPPPPAPGTCTTARAGAPGATRGPCGSFLAFPFTGNRDPACAPVSGIPSRLTVWFTGHRRMMAENRAAPTVAHHLTPPELAHQAAPPPPCLHAIAHGLGTGREGCSPGAAVRVAVLWAAPPMAGAPGAGAAAVACWCLVVAMAARWPPPLDPARAGNLKRLQKQ